MTARTLYDKLWDDHVVHTEADGTAILYIDRHLVHEVTSPQAYEGLREAGRKVWRVSSVVATADHNTPTTGWERGYDGIEDPISKEQVTTLDANISEHGAAAFFPGHVPILKIVSPSAVKMKPATKSPGRGFCGCVASMSATAARKQSAQNVPPLS